MTPNLFEGKNCLITGATGGWGLELSKEFAKLGCNLFLISTNEKKLQRQQKYLLTLNKNRTIIYQVSDLRNINDLKKIISKAKKNFKVVDILINCAGVFPQGDLTKSTLKDFEDCISINLKAPFFLIKEFSKGMKQRKWGRIINIGSSSSYEGFEDTSIYCASKHGLLGLSRSVYKELRVHNVRTFCISPGSIKTQMGRKVKSDFKSFIDPHELSQLIVNITSYDNEMISEEIQINRINGTKQH